MKQERCPFLTRDRVEGLSFLLLIAGYCAGYQLIYHSVILNHVFGSICAAFFCAFLFILFCYMRVRWIPESKAKWCGLTFGMANYHGSALLGGGVLIGVQILLGIEEFLFNQYWLLALVLSFIIGLLLHIWVATGIFWLVRRKWSKEQEGVNETDRT